MPSIEVYDNSNVNIACVSCVCVFVSGVRYMVSARLLEPVNVTQKRAAPQLSRKTLLVQIYPICLVHTADAIHACVYHTRTLLSAYAYISTGRKWAPNSEVHSVCALQ